MSVGTIAGRDGRLRAGGDAIINGIHVFRMPLFFALAGYFARGSLARRGPRRFAADRAKRILAPLVVLWPVAVLPVIVVAIAFAITHPDVPTTPPSDDPLAIATPAHLWFLWSLTQLYVLLLLASWLLLKVTSAERRERVSRRAGLLHADRTLAQRTDLPVPNPTCRLERADRTDGGVPMTEPTAKPGDARPGPQPGLDRALRIFPLVLLMLGVGLTVGVQDGRLGQREVLIVLVLGGLLATYRVAVAVWAVPRRVRQVGFWLTLPIVVALVVVAPAFVLYAVGQLVEGWLLFGPRARVDSRGHQDGSP